MCFAENRILSWCHGRFTYVKVTWLNVKKRTLLERALFPLKVRTISLGTRSCRASDRTVKEQPSLGLQG